MSPSTPCPAVRTPPARAPGGAPAWRWGEHLCTEKNRENRQRLMRAAVNVGHTNWKNIDKNDREMGEGLIFRDRKQRVSNTVCQYKT